MNGVGVVADNILVYDSGDIVKDALLDHDRNLKSLLKRKRKVNLKFSKTKLKLRVKALPCLGNLLTSGLKPDPVKVEAILKLHKPTDVTAV